MNPLYMLILGLVLLIVDYFAPAPPPVHTVLKILGWVLVVIGGVLLVFGLLGGPALR